MFDETHGKNAAFPQMRRSKQRLDQKQVAKILAHATHGVLALAPCFEGDFPYAVPLSYVYQNGAIYFHSALEGHKLDAMRANEQASFCVVGQDNVVPELFATSYESVIAFGSVHIVENEEERIVALSALGKKYSAGWLDFNGTQGFKAELARELRDAAPHAAVLRFDIEHLSGKMASQPVRARAEERAVTPAVHKSMQGNKRANTKPELLVRERLHEAGLTGYRLQWKVPGRPDIAWPGKKVALFVNGCFWHRCPYCKPSTPKKNVEYWTIKFEKNQERDKESVAQLEQMGWKVHVIWECQLKKNKIDQTMAQLLPILSAELGKQLRSEFLPE